MARALEAGPKPDELADRGQQPEALRLRRGDGRGVKTEDIDPDTLESFLMPGLYFAGEMVDIHADRRLGS